MKQPIYNYSSKEVTVKNIKLIAKNIKFILLLLSLCLSTPFQPSTNCFQTKCFQNKINNFLITHSEYVLD